MWRALWMPTHLVGESDIYITNLPRLNCENTYYCLRNLPELVVKTERSQYVTWPKSHLQFPQENLSVCCDLICLYITSCLISHPCLYSPHKHEENRSKLQIFFFFFFIILVPVSCFSVLKSCFDIQTQCFGRRALMPLSVLPLFSPWLQSWSAVFHFN